MFKLILPVRCYSWEILPENIKHTGISVLKIFSRSTFEVKEKVEFWEEVKNNL